MKTIVLFGAGNVASHLFKAFAASEEFKVIQIYNHRKERLESFKIPVTTQISEVVPADIYLLAVKDDAISEISKALNSNGALVCHTSGAVPLNIFSSFKRAGVFYPLQTFSKDKEVDFSNIPICIESKISSDLELLKDLANSISNKVYEISSEQRKSLHIAAVFVSNFVNYLYSQGEEICHNNRVPFEILQPLIEETAAKIKTMKPIEAQTGPAKRNDEQVIDSHLQLLNEEQQQIYKLLTRSIQTLHGKKL